MFISSQIFTKQIHVVQNINNVKTSKRLCDKLKNYTQRMPKT